MGESSVLDFTISIKTLEFQLEKQIAGIARLRARSIEEGEEEEAAVKEKEKEKLEADNLVLTLNSMGIEWYHATLHKNQYIRVLSGHHENFEEPKVSSTGEPPPPYYEVGMNGFLYALTNVGAGLNVAISLGGLQVGWTVYSPRRQEGFRKLQRSSGKQLCILLGSA